MEMYLKDANHPKEHIPRDPVLLEKMDYPVIDLGGCIKPIKRNIIDYTWPSPPETPVISEAKALSPAKHSLVVVRIHIQEIYNLVILNLV